MSTAPPWRPATMSTTQSSRSPAYIPVHARRNLAPSAPQTTATESNGTPRTEPAASQGARSKIEWAQPIRHYVQRSFVPEHQVPDITRQELEQKLKEVITKAAESGNLNDVDWDNLPLPQQMILSERRGIPTVLSQPSWRGVSNNYVLSSVKDTSQKRKSAEFDAPPEERSSTPPWRIANSKRNELEHRTSFHSPTDKRRRLDNWSESNTTNNNSKAVSSLKGNLETRRRRFEDSGSGSGYQSPASNTDEPNKDSGPVVGTCQKLEKNYFRLTAPPKPENVRPLEVLKKSLDLLKKKWKHEGNYGYICDQFKSLRQDLTVQHIKNDFTVSVYEIHARIALEKGDLGEYNQCQTQLRALYAMQLGGHPTEFKAYRILYFIYTRNQTAITAALADLTPAEKLDAAVRHALEVRSALALGNYHRFFRLYLDTPNMGAYLMDMFVDRERLSALCRICKVYKPDVKLRFITEELGFENDQEAVHFILEYAPEELLQQVDDGVKLLTGQAGRVFEDAKAEAHRVIDIKGQI